MRRRRGRQSGPPPSFSRRRPSFNSRHRHSHRGRHRGGFGFGGSPHSHSRSNRSRGSHSSGFRGSNSFLPPQRAFTSSFRPSSATTPDSVPPPPPVPVAATVPLNPSSSRPDPEGVPTPIPTPTPTPPNPYLSHHTRQRRHRSNPSYLTSLLSRDEVRSSGVGKKWVELRRERYPSLRDEEIEQRRVSRNEMFLGLGKRKRYANTKTNDSADSDSDSDSEDEIDVMRTHLWERAQFESSSFFGRMRGRGRGRGRGRVQIRRKRRRRFGGTQRVRVSLSRTKTKKKKKTGVVVAADDHSHLHHREGIDDEEESSESDDVLEYGEEEVDFDAMRNAVRNRAAKKRQRMYRPRVPPTGVGTNTTLLGRLLEKDVEKEELAVLQCFRHFIVNGFFVEDEEELDDDIRRRLKERGVI